MLVSLDLESSLPPPPALSPAIRKPCLLGNPVSSTFKNIGHLFAHLTVTAAVQSTPSLAQMTAVAS